MIAGIMEVSTPGGIDENSVVAVVIGLLLFAFLGASLVALGLGIDGLIQKEHKKIFAILGTVFAAAAIMITLFIMILGFAMKS